jgi:light-regulated signal transduction histidine kinase (bacteriophytochrome)
MTETEKLRQQLKQTQLAYLSAIETSQFKGGFLGRVAHELRSPLSSLMGLHQLIIYDLCENSAEEREFVTQAYESAKKLMGLIDELVTISKIESSRIELELKPLQLKEILAEIYTLTHLQAANRNLTLVISEPEANFYVMADEKRLLQCLVNLMEVTINNTETGKIIIKAQYSPSQDFLEINLDVPTAAGLWSEPIDLISPPPVEAKPLTQPPQFSDAMKIWLAQTLLESMGGKLQISALSPETETESITRLQCLLAGVSPSDVVQLIQE